MAQVIKDAVCDRFRDATGRRPSVDRSKPDVRINARVDRDRCILSLDASGERLHRRGYRVESGEAPLKETLAAGILALSGWSGDRPVVDPMCGSGTFLIEAAMIATHRAPGLARVQRAGFGFMAWLDHRPDPFNAYVDGLRSQVTELPSNLLFGADKDPAVLDTCRRNLRRAGFLDAVNIERSDVRDFTRPTQLAPVPAPVLVVSNPPYGQRLGDRAELEQTYGALGTLLKRCFPSSRAAFIVGEDAPHTHFGLRPNARKNMRNGPIPCRLLHIDVHGDRPR